MAPAAVASRPITIQGDTITIHISGASASPNDISRAVEEALRRRDSDKAARLRSSYIDD
ncbi:hypothetical protein D3C72_2492660 [compost metagenome]